MLEAMSYNIDVLVSDIPANLQIGLDDDDYYSVGDEEKLIEAIIKKISEFKNRSFDDILSTKFNWDNIAKQTDCIYKKLIA